MAYYFFILLVVLLDLWSTPNGYSVLSCNGKKFNKSLAIICHSPVECDCLSCFVFGKR